MQTTVNYSAEIPIFIEFVVVPEYYVNKYDNAVVRTLFGFPVGKLLQ